MIKILVLVDYSTEFSRRFLKGLIQYSKNNGSWIIYRLPDYYKTMYGEDGVVKWSKEWKADGIIAQWENEDMNLLKNLNVPVFLQNYKEKDNFYSTILGDYLGTGIMAAKFFIQRRFQNFAFYGNKNFVWSQERSEGYKQEVEKNGGNYFYFETETLNSDHRSHSCLQLNEWLLSLPKPVALFACDDSYALQVSEACQINNIQIPNDIALLGVDNDELICNLSDPTISSIVLDAEKGGYEVGRLMQKSIENGKNEPFNIYINPTRFELRQSTEKYNISNEHILEVVKFLEKNFTSKISIDFLTHVVPLSRRSLEVKFKEEIKMSIYQFILNLRIEYFAHLLLTTDRSIFDLIIDSGFNDYTNAYRMFKKIKSYTPIEYRQKFRDINFHEDWKIKLDSGFY